MRIAFLVGNFPSTSETFVLSQITGLIKRGHQVSIFPTGKGVQGENHETIARFGVMERVFYRSEPRSRAQWFSLAIRSFVKHFPGHPFQMLDALNGFRHGWKNVRLGWVVEYAFWLEHGGSTFDIVMCHFGPFGLKAVELRRRGCVRGKVVTAFHAFDLSTYVRAEGNDVYRSLFADGDLFMPITEYARKKLEALGCPEGKMVVHHMGVDCKLFAPRRGEPRDTAPTKLVAVGRLAGKKGFEFAVRAVALLRRNGADVALTLIGHGPLRNSLEALARQLGIAEETHFLGWQTQAQVRQNLEDAHIFLMPSVTADDGDEEGLPVALMEAMAMGLPVVATRHAGIPELVEDGVTGLLVEERDADGLAQKIRVLMADTDLRRELCRNARRRIEEGFDVNKLNDRLVRIFEDLVSDRTRKSEEPTKPRKEYEQND